MVYVQETEIDRSFIVKKGHVTGRRARHTTFSPPFLLPTPASTNALNAQWKFPQARKTISFSYSSSPTFPSVILLIRAMLACLLRTQLLISFFALLLFPFFVLSCCLSRAP